MRAHFLCLHGPHERGMRFLLRTTLNCPSGDCPVFEEVEEGGVGVIFAIDFSCPEFRRSAYAFAPDTARNQETHKLR